MFVYFLSCVEPLRHFLLQAMFNKAKPTCCSFCFPSKNKRKKTITSAFSFPLTFMSGAKGARCLSLARRTSCLWPSRLHMQRRGRRHSRGAYCGISFDSLIPTAGFLVGSFSLSCACAAYYGKIVMEMNADFYV